VANPTAVTTVTATDSDTGDILTDSISGFVWSSEYDLKGVNSSRTVDENGTDLSFGLGPSLGLDQVASLPSGMAAQFDWQRFDLADEWVDLFSLGLRYRFH
jgi:hypothetical protein